MFSFFLACLLFLPHNLGSQLSGSRLSYLIQIVPTLTCRVGSLSLSGKHTIYSPQPGQLGAYERVGPQGTRGAFLFQSNIVLSLHLPNINYTNCFLNIFTLRYVFTPPFSAQELARKLHQSVTPQEGLRRLVLINDLKILQRSMTLNFFCNCDHD
jgi:hypothetical protein